MHSETILIITFLSFMLYSLLSKAVGKSIITLPIIFMGVGFALSGSIEHSGQAAHIEPLLKTIAEITLVLVLFADASHVRLSNLRQSYQLPMRMLLIGMPLTIAFGTLLVWGISPAAGLPLAFLTAALLTPTDAALGQTVVSSPNVPGHLSQSINVESGLNDGLALPFVLIGAILSSTMASHSPENSLFTLIALQVILGPLVGILFGVAVAKALDIAQNRDWINESAQGVVFLSTAFAAFFTAEWVGGNGFIAAFIAGMAFGNTYKHDPHFVREFMEGAGQILTMTAFLIFGALLLPAGIEHATLPTFIIAIAFLSVIRMAPIFLSLTGTGLPSREKLFLGWFGPRGLASILFTLIMMESYDFPGEEELLACVSMTVAMSVILHGLSATPLARLIGKKG